MTRRGDEYRGVFPVWDWSHVPGVTAPDGVDRREPGQGTLAGSLSDGTYGLTGFAFAGMAGLGARKAWFFGDRSVTCLGAGISKPANWTGPVTTTLAQRRLLGPVRYGRDDEDRSVERGTVVEDRPVDWLHHDGIGYVFPERTAATVSTRVREGSWHDINRQYDDEPVGMPVFAAWVDHGTAPDGKTYAYVLRPGTGPDAMPDVAADPGVAVPANDAAVQAVRTPDPGLVQAVFYEGGTVDLEAGPAVSVEVPCLLQLRERTDSTVATVVDPTGTRPSVALTVGGDPWEVPLADCPRGREAGTTAAIGRTPIGSGPGARIG